MLDDNDVRLVEQIALRAARETVHAAPKTGLLTQPVWVPATVSGGGAPGGEVWVFVDGDENAEAIPVENASGVPLGDQARVMVLFRPTGGALIVGHAGGSGAGLASAVKLDTDAALLSLVVPQGANEFELRASLRSNRAALQDSIAVRLNEDAASTYLTAYLYNVGTTPKAFYEGDVGRFYAGECHGDTAPSTRWSPCRVECFNVAGSTAQKEGLADSSVAGTTRVALGWLWPQTSPITLIELRPWYGTLWKSGSTARLYVR